MEIILDHLEVDDLLTLRAMNKTLYRFIGSTYAAKLKKKLSARCVSVSIENSIKSLDRFITDTSWAFEGMMNSQNSSNTDKTDFETFPLPLSNFRLRVIQKSTFVQETLWTFVDRYGSWIKRLWIDEFWCCLPSCSGEGAFYSSLYSLTDLSIEKSNSSLPQHRTATRTIKVDFPETLTTNLESLRVKSEDVGRPDCFSLVMEWFTRCERLERFRIPEILYKDEFEDIDDEDYCHDDKTLLQLFLLACSARKNFGFPMLKYLDLGALTWKDNSIEHYTDLDWVSFQRWILRNRTNGGLHLENVACGFFSLVSPSPGNRKARSLAEVILSLNSVNHKFMQLDFPHLKTLNLMNGDEEWKMNAEEEDSVTMVQKQSMWPSLTTIHVYSDRNTNDSEVRYISLHTRALELI
jgi:hypothetical protein